MKAVPLEVVFSNQGGGKMEVPFGSETGCLAIVMKGVAFSIDDWRGLKPDDVFSGNIVENVCKDFCL